MKVFLQSLGFKLYKDGCALLLGLLALCASALPSSAFAACTLTVNSVSATPASAVGATVTATAVLQYSGCLVPPTTMAIKDNAPANLTYASCGVLGSDWNCANVATASGVTTSTFVSGNNGNKTETVTYAYTAAAIGCPSISITPVIAGVAGAARASTCSAAPSVSTNSATGTASTSATLNGTVVSNGNAVSSITFQYGTSSGVYGAPLAATPGTLVAGAAATAVSKTVSGLSCGTTYYYRANATNSQGTTNGPEQRFKACFSLTKVASSANVPVGTNFTYALTAANATGNSLANVVVTDDVSAPGLSYLSCTTATGSCSASGTLVTWDLGNLAHSATATATLTVQASTAGAKTNSASANTTGAPVATSVVNAYAPLADWRMDEASWNGTAGEVKDSTGNGYNGKAAKAAGTTAVPSTLSTVPLAYSSGGRSSCGYGDFVRSSGPTRDYSYVELTGIPPLPTSFTFAAWIRTTDNATSGQRILVRDDNSDGWGFSLGDVAPGKIRFFNRNIGAGTSGSGNGTYGCSGATFCLDTAAVITNNNWFFIAVAIDTVAKSVTHYVFDSNGVAKSVTSATFPGTWKDGTGLASIGGETASSSEGRTQQFHFKGNIDELQIYQGVLSQADLGLLLTRTRTCAGSGPDHVELVHNGAALTCSAKAVKVLGCTTASSCSSSAADQYVGNVTFTPDSYAGAQWCTDALCTATLSGAITVASGTTLYLREPTVRTDTLGGTDTGTLTSALQCKNTATSAFGTSSAACNLAFAGTGFLVNVPNHTACTAQTVTLQAVQSSATGNTCAPAFQGVNRTVSLYAGYTNPSTGYQTASLNYVTNAGGASTPVAALSMAAGSPTTLTNLYFDNTGTARLTGFTYPDTGQVTLYPTYTGSVANNDSGLTMAAASGNAFIAAPASFAFSGIPAAPLTAGTAFNVTVTAQNACATPATTLNFGRETGGATVVLASSNPLPGMGKATAISQTLSGFSSGAASTSVKWNEVGTVDLVASTVNYLGSALSPSSTQTAVGRFKPAYFDTTVVQGCSSFTYSGQPMAVSVTAMAAGGSNTTENYAGSSWARLVTLSDANGGTGTWTANTIAASSFAKGVGTAPLASYTFAAAATAPATVKLRGKEPLGADGVDSSTGAEGSTSIRSGRIRLQNSYGSELLALKLPVRIEYFDTSPVTGWRAGSDTCTNLSAANFAFSYPVSAKNNMSACETAGTLSGVQPSITLSLSKPCTGIPCAGNSGWTDLALNLGSAAIGTVAGSAYVKCTAVGGAGGAETPANLPWLRFNWMGAGLANPTARASFGLYKSPLIYSRENY